MLDAAAGPSRAHRLRLLRAGDDPLRARELQGFRFRAAACPGAACSYAMQERALGGLSARTRRLLCGPEPSPVRHRRALRPGTVLVREWHGVGHQVRVLDHGVLYRGERYGSLSEIGRLITRARSS